MILHWLSTAWRSLVSNPLFSAITIASLSIGCCGALLAGSNIRQHLAFERWIPDAERVLLVRPHFQTAANANPRAANIWLYAENGAVETVPGFLDQTRVGEDRLTLPSEPGQDGEQIRGLRIERNFFDFFGLTFIEGSAGNDGVVLSESLAHKLYGAPPWIDKLFATGVSANSTIGMRTKVGAVIRDMPATSQIHSDFFSYHRPDVMARNATNWHADWVGGHYVRVKPGVKVTDFQAAMAIALDQGAARAYPNGTEEDDDGVPAGAQIRYSSLPLPDVHLAGFETSGVNSSAEAGMLVAMASAALALLAVSAFNYVTLSLARSMRRRPEVAMRKVLGAGGGAVMRHYLVESFVITALSLALGFALAELLHPWFARSIGQPEELISLYDPVFVGGALAGGVLLALVVGAYPAIYLAHIRPRQALEQTGMSAPGPVTRVVSGGLLGLQIVGATVLLAVALIMAAQAQYVASRPLGYDMSHTLAVGIVCPPPPQPKPPPGTPEQAGAALPASACDLPLVERIKAMPGVASVTRGGTDDLFADTLGSASVTRPGQSAHLGETHRVAVETDFLQTMDARLLAGRLFDSSSAYDRQLLSQRIGFDTAQADTVPVVVTRAFLPMVGVLDPQEAIGQQFAMPAYARGVRAFEVVGVVEDWHRRTLRHAIDPIVFTPGGWTMQIIVKTTPEAQLTVRNAIRDINPPGRPPAPGTPFIRKLVMLDDDFTSSFREDQRLMAAVAGFAAFAMGVAALGVFALSAFEIRRRVREIGIRKALGAGPAKMAGMVLGQSLLSAAIASLLAWPIAWWAAGAWLSSFVYRTELAPALLPVASLFVITFVALAVSFNAARAAAVRPNIALRTTG